MTIVDEHLLGLDRVAERVRGAEVERLLLLPGVRVDGEDVP
jgi:hypothetical protein